MTQRSRRTERIRLNRALRSAPGVKAEFRAMRWHIQCRLERTFSSNTPLAQMSVQDVTRVLTEAVQEYYDLRGPSTGTGRPSNESHSL